MGVRFFSYWSWFFGVHWKNILLLTVISEIQDVTHELFIINLLQACIKSQHSLQLPVQYFAKQSEAP